MTDTLTINTAVQTVSTPDSWCIAPVAGVSNDARISRTIPAFVRADEAYYWSFRWQQDVAESMAALASGDYEDFDSDDPNDVARWLLSMDD